MVSLAVRQFVEARLTLLRDAFTDTPRGGVIHLSEGGLRPRNDMSTYSCRQGVTATHGSTSVAEEIVRQQRERNYYPSSMEMAAHLSPPY